MFWAQRGINIRSRYGFGAFVTPADKKLVDGVLPMTCLLRLIGRALNNLDSPSCAVVSEAYSVGATAVPDLVGRVLAERAVGDAASRAERGDVVVVPIGGERI
jgi:hypothetical protein